MQVIWRNLLSLKIFFFVRESKRSLPGQTRLWVALHYISRHDLLNQTNQIRSFSLFFMRVLLPDCLHVSLPLRSMTYMHHPEFTSFPFHFVIFSWISFLKYLFLCVSVSLCSSFVSFSLSWSWSRRDACSWRLDIIWRKVVSESDLQTSACCPSVVIYWIRSQIRRTASQKSDKITAKATCSYVVYIIVSGTHTVL